MVETGNKESFHETSSVEKSMPDESPKEIVDSMEDINDSDEEEEQMAKFYTGKN
jgi:hypothetical protein